MTLIMFRDGVEPTMVAVGRRCATWVLLTGYLFAVTAAHCFHEHGGHAASGRQAAVPLAILAAASGEGIAADHDGTARPQGDEVDIGAYELAAP